uniref:Hepatic lectin n=1 Tax=Magallana gigas TaxID=29159 RepID=K1RJY9_MAGGI
MAQSFEIGQKLPATPFMVFNSFGVQMCLSECEKYVMCSSLNYNLKHFVCELNSGWKTESLSWINDDEYVYHEIPRPINKVCGAETCNADSRCVRTAFDTFVCVPVVCTDSEPVITNGIVQYRTYMPSSITYGCSPGFVDCPGTWESYAGQSYCFVTNQVLSWSNAKNICYDMKAYLMEIGSQEEQTWIRSKATQKLWFGVTDEGSEGAWYWENSRNAPTFTAWQPGEPGGGGGENCAVLDESSGWQDYPCTYTFQFVCEK